jgi:hypothetical protein
MLAAWPVRYGPQHREVDCPWIAWAIPVPVVVESRRSENRDWIREAAVLPLAHMGLAVVSWDNTSVRSMQKSL